MLRRSSDRPLRAAALLFSTGSLVAAFFAASPSAEAQEAPRPAAAPAAPAAPAAQPPSQPQADVVKDGFRLRGGFSINGGAVLLPAADTIGGSFGLAARLGAQINHLFGVYYQNTPMVLLVPGDSGVTAGFADYNSFVPNVTFLHTIELGAGPSVDFVAVAGCSDKLACSGDTTVAFGTHGRVAFNIGGLAGNGPRRSGFALGTDFHAAFLPGAAMLSATVGLGAEWY